MIDVNVINITYNNMFKEFIHNYLYNFGVLVDQHLLSVLRSNINDCFYEYIMNIISKSIYVHDSILIIDKSNPYIKELDFLNYSRILIHRGIYKCHLTDEELFYLKLKYNVIDGCCDITNTFKIELELADNGNI